VRFVPPGAKDAYYEVRVFESGEVETRPESLHDWFNALAWLSFPRTKARINALHAVEIPREGGRRGRRRDMLTLFDEGGAIVQCTDAQLVEMISNFEWKHLFWTNRERVRSSMRILVLGHAVLEKALEPWGGLTCKVVFAHGDAEAADVLSRCASPRELAPLPVFGYPGWLEQDEAFYEDTRYFRERRSAR